MSRSRRLTRAVSVSFVLSLIALALPLAAPAFAGHGTCTINLTPDTDTNTLGDPHTVTATLVAPAGQTTDTCRAGGKIDVDFEVTGEAGATYNPAFDAASTPTNPDLSCSINPNSTSCSVTYTRTSPPGTDSIVGFFSDAGIDAASDPRDTVSKTWVAPTATRLDCAPETATNATGTTHTVTCTVTNNTGATVNGVNVDVELTGANDTDGDTPTSPDRTCTTATNGTCTVTLTGADTGTTTFRAFIDSDNNNATSNADATEGQDSTASPGATAEPDATDVVTKTWTATTTTATRLDCNPETDSNPTGTAHVITCTATNNSGQTVAGAQIDVEFAGANDTDAGDTPATPDATCTTNAQGVCTITHGTGGVGTTNNAGTTTYRAFIDFDSNNTTGGPDTTEGQAETTTPGSLAEPDNTDVVTKTWVSGPSRVTITPTNDSASVGTCNPFTITVTDSGNQPVAGVGVDVEQVHSLATNTTANDEPTVSFCTPTSGANPSNVDEGRGDLRENPDNRGTAGGETTTVTNSAGQVTIGIAVAPQGSATGAGTVTVTAFVETTDNDDPDTADPKATATKTWVVAEGRTINCEPETATNPVRTSHTITCTVTDRFGDPIAGEGVTFTSTGPGTLQASSPTTDANGRVTATITSNEQGTQSVTGTLTDDLNGAEPNEVDECDRGANDPTGAPAGVCADTVTKTWGPPAAGTVCPGFENDTRNQIVGTEGNDTLTGTEGADIICGLGGSDSISGLGGNDLILGGGGNDSLSGGDGDDAIKGGPGSDVLSGNAGNDVLRGGGGSDILLGGAGSDVLRGGGGDDVLRGGGGPDRMYGGPGNDVMNGGRGRDRCRGGTGRDISRNC